jgi:hypothetical protein
MMEAEGRRMVLEQLLGEIQGEYVDVKIIKYGDDVFPHRRLNIIKQPIQ